MQKNLDSQARLLGQGPWADSKAFGQCRRPRPRPETQTQPRPACEHASEQASEQASKQASKQARTQANKQASEQTRAGEQANRQVWRHNRSVACFGWCQNRSVACFWVVSKSLGSVASKSLGRTFFRLVRWTSQRGSIGCLPVCMLFCTSNRSSPSVAPSVPCLFS